MLPKMVQNGTKIMNNLHQEALKENSFLKHSLEKSIFFGCTKRVLVPPLGTEIVTK